MLLEQAKCVRFIYVSQGQEWSGILFTFCPTAPSLLLCLPNTYTHRSFSPLQAAVALTPSKRAKAGPERLSYTLTRTRGRGRRSGNRQYLILHLPFCPPHSRPILHLLKSLPFLFVLFSVSADFPFIHLASSHKQCVTPDLAAYCIP